MGQSTPHSGALLLALDTVVAADATTTGVEGSRDLSGGNVREFLAAARTSPHVERSARAGAPEMSVLSAGMRQHRHPQARDPRYWAWGWRTPTSRPRVSHVSVVAEYAQLRHVTSSGRNR